MAFSPKLQKRLSKRFQVSVNKVIFKVKPKLQFEKRQIESEERRFKSDDRR